MDPITIGLLLGGAYLLTKKPAATTQGPQGSVPILPDDGTVTVVNGSIPAPTSDLTSSPVTVTSALPPIVSNGNSAVEWVGSITPAAMQISPVTPALGEFTYSAFESKYHRPAYDLRQHPMKPSAQLTDDSAPHAPATIASAIAQDLFSQSPRPQSSVLPILFSVNTTLGPAQWDGLHWNIGGKAYAQGTFENMFKIGTGNSITSGYMNASQLNKMVLQKYRLSPESYKAVFG